MTNPALHYYARFRQRDGDKLAVPAMAAWNSARSHVHFRAQLREMVEDSKRRTKAAKKGWKTRRARAA